MKYTEDQYYACAALERWYRNFNHQIIDIAGIEGTGVCECVKLFLDKMEFDPREIAYLSFDQKQVLEMAAKRYHCYFVNGIIYKYTRVVDFNTIPVVNQHATEIEFEWKKSVRKHIDPRYKIIVVFDSVLMNRSMLADLASFGLPIILMRDPMAIPSPDSYIFTREPNILLSQLNPEILRSPIVYTALKMLRGERLAMGNYDSVSVLPKKQMNLYNMKSNDMILTMTDEVANEFNRTYREKINNLKSTINCVGERVIVMNNLYDHRLVNKDEKRIKVYLSRGTIGFITKCIKHAEGTKYVPIELRPDGYFESFEDLNMDRHYLNDIDAPSRQEVPEDIIQLKYAYALPIMLARVSHWDKVMLVADDADESFRCRMLYSAALKANESLTVFI